VKRAGIFFTTVTQDAEAEATATALLRSITGETDHALTISPAVAFAGPPTALRNSLSLLAPLPAESLSSALIAPPVKSFQDDYGAALLAHAYNAVRRGGILAVPWHAARRAGQTRFWSLDWLAAIAGAPERVNDKAGLAVFRRAEALPMPESVLAYAIQHGHSLLVDFLSNRERNGNATLMSENEGLVQPGYTVAEVQSTRSSITDPAAEAQRFYANLNYTITGVAYKTEGLRRFIRHYLADRRDCRVLDVGGGAGYVGAELLLTDPSVHSVIVADPLPGNLLLARHLFVFLRRRLEGRFRFAPVAIQDYGFEEELDMVCAFASLLYVPRTRLREVLEKAWNSLRPGGLLVIHENISRPCFAEKEYYNLMFTVEELEGYLSRLGTIDYYRSSDISPMARNKTGNLTVFRVLRKT
jgi:SAM-dependent methyltransferase